MNRVAAKCLVFRLLLGGLLAAGLLLRYAGLDEPIQLHPDERNIARWMERMRATGSLRPDVYAGGFFVLANAARTATEGLVQHVGQRWAYFIGTADQPGARPLDPVVFGRHFNVWLGTLAILLAAGLARRLTGSRAAALVAAALMAFAAYPIEHAHYLESDLAMLATLLLALWALSRFLATRRVRDWIWAAVLAGFAAGTKFPLAVLVVPLLASVRAPLAHPRPVRRMVLLLGLAAACVLLGFVAATPDAIHWHEFRAGMQAAGNAVFAETADILGPAAGEPFARQHMNAANLVRFAGALRPGWLLLAALGLPLCFARRFRPYWPVAVLFPAALAAQIALLAPWSRSQEFMALIPNFCLWAAVPAAALWSARGRAPKAAALVLAAAAVWPVAQTGVAVSSQFAWEDTRRLANRTLTACFPPGQPLAAERYAAPAEAGATPHVWPMSEYATAAHRLRERSDAPDYLLLNADFDTRRLCDPRTRTYFPPFAENWAALETEGRKIAAWGALASPAPQPYFRAPRIELWHRRAGALPATADLGVELPRPALVADEGRTTFFRDDLRAGPRRALLVDKRPREIAIGGPGDFDGPVFLVFRTHERAAAVRVDGFGRTARLALGPYDSGAIALERPWWNPRWARYERVAVRAETGGPTLTYLPCFLRVAFDPLEAASILLDDGHPARAVALLRDQAALDAAGPFWQVLAGCAAARGAAEALLAQWNAWLARAPDDPPAILSGGLPLSIWQDFARIRLVKTGMPLNLPLKPESKSSYRSAVWAQILPVPDAPQRLELLAKRADASSGNAHAPGQLHLDADNATPLGQCDFPDASAESSPPRKWILAAADFPRELACTFRSASGGTVRLEDAQFLWSWRDMLAVRAAQLRRALEPPAAPAADRYGDWLALRSVRIANDQAVLEFEALQDDVPPFAVQLHVRKHRKWRPLGDPVPLPHKPSPWPPGERRNVSVPLPPDVPPDRIGVALATDVQWHSSQLPCTGASEKRPFPVLADLAARP